MAQAKGNTTTHPKMGSLKGSIWQLLAAKYGDVVAKLPRLDKVVAVWWCASFKTISWA
jgi:hypothetical protein